MIYVYIYINFLGCFVDLEKLKYYNSRLYPRIPTLAEKIMFANYLLLVLWIVTLVQGDDDQYCDDTGCYPIVCDSDGCYVDYVVTKTELATYTQLLRVLSSQ